MCIHYPVIQKKKTIHTLHMSNTEKTTIHTLHSNTDKEHITIHNI